MQAVLLGQVALGRTVVKLLKPPRPFFQKKVTAFEAGRASADAILLIDRQAHQVLLSVGTDKPEKVADSYGW